MAKLPLVSNKEIERLYDAGSFRLSQERSDFLLPQILDFVRQKRWMNLTPEYQRRLVWDRKKKSLFVESLLMNVPIPAVFLFEYDLNRYEVMDGQQRLNTIIEFYENRLVLTGLETWAPLNGRTYSDCPPRIQSGLDRRRISATVLLAESIGIGGAERDDVRRQVFERLNTGGQQLNAQELRNCLYSRSFNDLLVDLAGNRLFDEIWDIPPYEENIRGDHISAELAENRLFRRMIDCEIVLRFFAFREKGRIKGSVRSILDKCMEDKSNPSESELTEMENAFLARLKLAKDIFGERTFRIENESSRWVLSQPLYDAVMVALDRQWDSRAAFRRSAATIKTALWRELKKKDVHQIVVGKPNTATAIKDRLDRVEEIFVDAIS